MLNRRNVMLGGAAGVCSAAVGTKAAATGDNKAKPTNFVLVHGTWHGGWLWRDVRNILEDEGHRVFTPTCTGCGERNHLISPDIGLETHIQDIVNVLDYEELEDVVLVGHSYAGLTITGAADRRRDKIRRLVFFDALVPRPGRMAGVPKDPETGELPTLWTDQEKSFIDGYQMVFWGKYPIEMLLPEEMTEHTDRLKRLITTHPAKQWTDELVIENGGWEGLNPAYIHCVGQKFSMTSERMVGPARGSDWEFIEIDAPRNAMMTHPDLSAETLMMLAALSELPR